MKDENKDKVYNDNQGHKLLALGAVWDYLQIKAEEADLDFNSIDFNDVMEKLKEMKNVMVMVQHILLN